MKNTFANGTAKIVCASECEFFSREIGVSTGHPVIVLNQPAGIGENSNRAFVQRLAACHRVIFYDTRAIRGLDRFAATNISDIALDAIKFIGTLGLELVDLLEFSIDALVAQQIVRERPDLIRRVILVGTFLSGNEGIKKVPAGLHSDVDRFKRSSLFPNRFSANSMPTLVGLVEHF
jgi:pimeloyl-ACP methyl ester carboxylesterase